MSFYSTVLQIALVILILIMTYIGVQMYRNRTAFIPEPAMCPDYWNLTGDGNMCKYDQINKGDYGSDALNVKQFKTPCEKYNWAKTNKVVWDGISNATVCT